MSDLDKVDDEAKRQCINEIKAVFKRWEQESDLESNEILECCSEAIDESYEEVDEIEFEPDGEN